MRMQVDLGARIVIWLCAASAVTIIHTDIDIAIYYRYRSISRYMVVSRPRFSLPSGDLMLCIDVRTAQAYDFWSKSADSRGRKFYDPCISDALFITAICDSASIWPNLFVVHSLCWYHAAAFNCQLRNLAVTGCCGPSGRRLCIVWWVNCNTANAQLD